jgi:hypothetical protein
MTFNILTKAIAALVLAILTAVAAFFGADYTGYSDIIAGVLAGIAVLAAAFIPSMKLVADGGSKVNVVEVVEEVAEGVEEVAKKIAAAKKSGNTSTTPNS